MDEFYGGNVFGYSLEPTSDKGLHRYVDFYSMLPEHIRKRPDLMNVVYLFQDYLNDGYRKIPEPTATYSYKNTSNGECGPSTQITSYSEVLRPFNHTPSMYKKLLSSALDFSNVGNTPIEEYNKERDLDTWAIDFSVMDAYKAYVDPITEQSNSDILLGDTTNLYSYYNEPKQYYSTLDFYNVLNSAYSNNAYSSNVFQNVFMYIISSVKNASLTLDEAALTISELAALIPLNGDLPEILFTYYACDATSFLADFAAFDGNTNVHFSVETRKTPYFYGVSDYTNYNEEPTFATLNPDGTQKYVLFDALGVDTSYTRSFRVSFGFKARESAATIRSMLALLVSNPVGEFALTIYPNSLVDVGVFSSDNIPCIASSLQTIFKYQHPEVFYSKFSEQNAHRHDPKKASVAEKIYRLAYSKDPKVFDYEYLRLVSQHFGYSIETDEQEINQNSYYKNKEEKELVLRKLIDNMPEYNRMKGTDSGIEMVLLSFGLVGRIITLFTTGSDKADGYAQFIDGRLISGDINEYAEANNIVYNPADPTQEATLSAEMSNQFKTHTMLSGTSIYDWYASPHFRIEFDILKDYLNIARSSTQFLTIAKTIRRIKPINTVFQGFYAKLTAEYGTLFINPPVGMIRGKQIMVVQSGCSFTDEWGTQCALELVYDS
jgi:hypothetical protein